MRSEQELLTKLQDFHQIITKREYIICGNNELHQIKLLLWALGILEAIPQISYRDTPEGIMYSHIFEYKGKPVWDERDILPIINSVLLGDKS